MNPTDLLGSEDNPRPLREGRRIENDSEAFVEERAEPNEPSEEPSRPRSGEEGPGAPGPNGSPLLEATGVVRYGTGAGSRFDLTVVAGTDRVPLTGIAARHLLHYGRIRKYAIEQGVVLPFLRHGNELWAEALSPAMRDARVEPSLEGEQIAEAVAAEIRLHLAVARRGADASDLAEGKVVPQGDRLLVSPTALVVAVRRRLLDDVLPRATIGEVAASRLGMRELRPRFRNGRPCAWSFPLSLLAVGEGSGEASFEDERVPSMDGSRNVTSPASIMKCELDGVDDENNTLHAAPSEAGSYGATSRESARQAMTPWTG